jgi:hypothetical protein
MKVASIFSLLPSAFSGRALLREPVKQRVKTLGVLWQRLEAFCKSRAAKLSERALAHAGRVEATRYRFFPAIENKEEHKERSQTEWIHCPAPLLEEAK